MMVKPYILSFMSTNVTWSTHEFVVYDPVLTNWNNVPGIYIFTGKNAQGQWVPLYIGKADSFQSRFSSHERWDEAARAGATHIHARVVELGASRDSIEQELIRMYQPRLNTHFR